MSELVTDRDRQLAGKMADPDIRPTSSPGSGVNSVAELLLALLIGTGLAPDTLLARRLFLAGRDQEALLHHDSALALYRAARRADPGYPAAHIGYIAIRLQHYQAAELAREYHSAQDTDLAVQCATLTAEVAADPEVHYHWSARQERLRHEPICVAMMMTSMGYGVSENVEIADMPRAPLAAPEIGMVWANYASHLPRSGAATREAVLEDGLRHVSHPFDRVLLLIELSNVRLERGDSNGARALRDSVMRAAARDGRPGLVLMGSRLQEPPEADTGRNWLRLARASRSRLEEWKALNWIAHEMIDRGQPRAALPFATRQVAIADSTASSGLRMISYTQRGRALYKAGQNDAALQDLQRAVGFSTEVRPLYYVADAWHNLAHCFESMGRFDAASRATNHFLQLTSTMPDNALRSTSLLDAGIIRWKAGQLAASREVSEELIRWVNTHHGADYWAGEYLERLGDLTRALFYYRRAATVDGDDIPRGLQGEVRIFEALGNDDSAEAAARAHDRQQWALPNEIPLVPRILGRNGRYDEALQVARRWATRQDSTGNVEGASLAHLEVADLLLAAHEPGAETEAVRAESLATRNNLTLASIDARRLIGLADLAAGRRVEGLNALMASATLARLHPDAPGRVAAWTALGDALATHQPGRALAAYDTAAQAIEDLVGRLGEDLSRAGYRERHIDPFDGAARLLLLSAPEANSVDELIRWSQRRTGAALSLGIRMLDPRARTAAPLGPSAIQHRLAADEALVSYLVLDSITAALVVTAHNATVVPLPVSRDSLRAMVNRLRAPLVAYAGRLDTARARFDVALAARLHAAVLRPLMSALGRSHRLIIVPDGPLHYLSFESLVSRAPANGAGGMETRYALDDFGIEYLPSIALLKPSIERSRRENDGGILAVTVGVDGGHEEITAIRSAWRSPVQVVADTAATQRRVLARVGKFAILHFAVHARADASDPLASYLALSPDSTDDGRLTLAAIAARQTHARLVVLSACETQAGRNYAGEGVLSLARGFLLGGAQGVVATRWPVGTTATIAMTAFYRALSRGAAPAEALRTAQLALRHDPRTGSPFFWAGFAMIRG